MKRAKRLTRKEKEALSAKGLEVKGYSKKEEPIIQECHDISKVRKSRRKEREARKPAVWDVTVHIGQLELIFKMFNIADFINDFNGEMDTALYPNNSKYYGLPARIEAKSSKEKYIVHHTKYNGGIVME